MRKALALHEASLRRDAETAPGAAGALRADGNEHFTFTTEIVVSPVFYGWLAGFGERAEILFPESVRAEFAAQCRKTLELYK